MQQHIRTSAKALIIEDRKLLALKLQNPNTFYTLPGGGQLPNESLHDTVKRECLEELGFHVTVGPLRFVRDYIADNHEMAHLHPGLHQVELIFLCTRRSPAAGAAHLPDAGQVGAAWLPLDQIFDFDLFPRALRPHLADLSAAPTYIGDVN